MSTREMIDAYLESCDGCKGGFTANDVAHWCVNEGHHPGPLGALTRRIEQALARAKFTAPDGRRVSQFLKIPVTKQG